MNSAVVASPLKLYESSPFSDGARSVILCNEKFAKEVLSLPSYPSLTNDQLLEICEHVNKVIG